VQCQTSPAPPLLFPQARVAELSRFYLRKVAAPKQLLLASGAITRARNHLEVMLRKTVAWKWQARTVELPKPSPRPDARKRAQDPYWPELRRNLRRLCLISARDLESGSRPAAPGPFCFDRNPQQKQTLTDPSQRLFLPTRQPDLAAELPLSGGDRKGCPRRALRIALLSASTGSAGTRPDWLGRRRYLIPRRPSNNKNGKLTSPVAAFGLRLVRSHDSRHHSPR